MEQADSTKKINLPSKRFLIRGGVAIIIVGLLLTIQTDSVKNLFSKDKKTALLRSEATVGEVVGKDSNNNGIADWEERLWGLDPTKLTTDGVANKTIIEQKRKQLTPNESDSEPLNETDRLARELFSVTTALSQSGLGVDDGLSKVGGKIGENIPTPDIAPHYAKTSVKTVTTSGKTLIAYRSALQKSLKNYSETLPEIEVIIQGLENGNTTQLDALNKTVAFYRSLTGQLLSMNVPRSVAQYHLDLINSTYGLAQSFEKMKVLDDNGIKAMVGFAEYRYHTEKINSAAESITTFLNEYDIL